ncbi:hypothetical protein GCM10007978_00790 [Shewanella hanedai]|jgi:hypothetical protein|uniref:Uncharacterized protein n=1 Tax=Shewanella hanedai TaxID=25 RepID=A0A553JUR9_SHEHA|nr:hypothetical protein [Shewanella hanedai]TRY16195.1 hypothetical protein FN961_00760 [Shewanella hanedai]GGI67092.1 hypothetical protein GCM10007978_00790 [Shewanella hanedai]
MTQVDKALLIELLDYPRKRIVQSMELKFCPHAGFFNSNDDQCLSCHQEMECVWMNHNDELVAVEEKPIQEIKQQLLIAVDFIDSSLSPHHLSRRNCECENCVWLRKAQQVLAIE